MILSMAILLAMAAISCLAVENVQGSHDSLREREFQHLVGGMGMGPATNMSECPALFDPRIAETCPYEVEPIPAGQDFFCSRHSCSVFCPFQNAR